MKKIWRIIKYGGGDDPGRYSKELEFTDKSSAEFMKDILQSKDPFNIYEVKLRIKI